MSHAYYIDIDLSKRELFILIVYFFFYSFLHIILPEHPIFYWLTLIIIPFGLLSFFQKKFLIYPTIKLNLSFAGLKRGNFKSGIIFGLFMGIIYSAFQYIVIYGNSPVPLTSVLVYEIPIALILVAITTGITNEFFFRGLLQTRLNRILVSPVTVVLISSLIYCFFNFIIITFDSQNLIVSSFYSISNYTIHSFLTGIILGTIYLVSNQNLISVIIGHIFMNFLPVLIILDLKYF